MLEKNLEAQGRKKAGEGGGGYMTLDVSYYVIQGNGFGANAPKLIDIFIVNINYVTDVSDCCGLYMIEKYFEGKIIHKSWQGYNNSSDGSDVIWDNKLNGNTHQPISLLIFNIDSVE